MVLDRESSQEYPVNAGVTRGFIFGPSLFLLYMNDLPDDVICNIAVYADDTTFSSKCDQAAYHASDLCQQLELASELESNLQDTVDWAESDLSISMLEKLNWFRLTGLIKLVLLM